VLICQPFFVVVSMRVDDCELLLAHWDPTAAQYPVAVQEMLLRVWLVLGFKLVIDVKIPPSWLSSISVLLFPFVDV
jgi:hypothetical protein